MAGLVSRTAILRPYQPLCLEAATSRKATQEDRKAPAGLPNTGKRAIIVLGPKKRETGQTHLMARQACLRVHW